jgi:MFS transporter, DHA1 family, staphyloferrin A biosynthesis exporter
LEPVAQGTLPSTNEQSRAPSSTVPQTNTVDPGLHHGTPAPPAGIGSVFSSLRHRNYRLLWFGTLLMSAGQWIQQVTLGWLLYDLTGSAVLLGALNGFRALPFLVFGPLAGVAADRFDRRGLLLLIQPALAVITTVMGVLVLFHMAEVWHLFLFTFLTASMWSITQPVRQTLVPNLVPKRDLMNALALNSMGFNSMKVVGPALGGLLIAAFGAAGNFFVQGLVYSVLMLTIYFMQAPPTPANARKSSPLSNLKEGLLYVKSTPVVLTLIIISLIPHMLSLPITNALMPVFQKDVLGVGPEGLGLLLAAPGIGAVTATFVLAAWASRVKRKGVVMLVGLGMLGASIILFAQMRSLPMAMLALFFMGACQMSYMTTANTVVQVVVPDQLRGRVMSIWMLDQGLGPIGALFAGISTELIGAPYTATWMGAVVILLALGVAWRVPRIRQIET